MRDARLTARSAAMLIELEHATLRDDLAAFLRRCGCTVATASYTELEVDPPTPVIPDTGGAPEVEIAAYVRAWAELNAVRTPRLRSRSA